MRFVRPLFLALAVTVVSPDFALGQPRDLDLAKTAPGSARTFRVEPGTPIDLTVVNRLPGKVYTIAAQVDFIPIAAFTLDGFRGVQGGTTGQRAFSFTDSKGIDCSDAEEAILNATEEPEILKVFAAHPSCKVQLQPDLSESLGSYELAAGEVLTVEIERDGNTWKWTFSTGARGEWRTTYGFTFVPNEDRKYVTRPEKINNVDKFRIFEQKDREELDFVPSVLFNWLPAKQRGQDWVDGFTAGLGWDLEKPVVFAGWSWMYNENLNVTVGAAIHQQTRLLGKYDVKGEGSVVGEALESAQLVETTYGPNFYVGVGFRFDRDNDPFARGASLREQTAQAEATRLKNAATAAEAKRKAEELQKACEAEATRVHTAALATCKAGDAANLDACNKLADHTEAAAKAKCPADVAQALAEAAAAKARESLADQKRKDCRALAESTLAVGKDACEKTKRGALEAAEKAHNQALTECAKKPDAERPACVADAGNTLTKAKSQAEKVATECVNLRTQERDAALLDCDK
ncbi:MAG: hypothetical protein SF066_11345 [Thermoanaerobaculia bacterium]|nr:hypothetical protein [Thermoanaerobaculia bacterium]